MYESTLSSSKERYCRQLPVLQPEGQEKLAEATVFIAGAGGLGSPVATYLTLAGVGEIIIADSDRVEESNLNRQFLHSTGDIGKKKVYSALSTLHALNPDISLVAEPLRIEEDTIEDMVRDVDIIVDAVDSYETRYLLNRVAFSKKIPFVHGAIEGFGGQMTTIIPDQSPCLSCIFPKAPPARPSPVIGATAGVIGSMQAVEVVKLITGFGIPMAGRLLIWDGLSGKSQELTFKKRQNCQVCGTIQDTI